MAKQALDDSTVNSLLVCAISPGFQAVIKVPCRLDRSILYFIVYKRRVLKDAAIIYYCHKMAMDRSILYDGDGQVRRLTSSSKWVGETD